MFDLIAVKEFFSGPVGICIMIVLVVSAYCTIYSLVDVVVGLVKKTYQGK
jgi:hypothetical protein